MEPELYDYAITLYNRNTHEHRTFMLAQLDTMTTAIRAAKLVAMQTGQPDDLWICKSAFQMDTAWMGEVLEINDGFGL